MSFNRHYQQELAFLRDSGRAFAAAHPDAARHLAEAGAFGGARPLQGLHERRC